MFKSYAPVPCIHGASNAMYYRSTTMLVFALNNYSGIRMCFALPEKRIFATLSRVNVIRTCESTTTPARDTRRCAYGIHKRRCVCTCTSSLSMAHCLSHQFAGFMRGLNEVIGFASAINVLIAVLIRPFLS